MSAVTTPAPLTEKAALTDLVTWAEKRPAWRRDALRRLVTGETLDDQAIAELTELCLDPTRTHTPISQSHIVAETSAAEPISLVSIKNPTAINALASLQELSFKPSGLTVVYGDNGSGKSGYVRVLKHACRSRDEKFAIHRDLEDKTDTPQSAEICFARGANTEQFNWTPDGEPHGDLPSVSIFDSRSASIHVESTNEVAYIPRPMRLLEALAETSDRIKTALDARIATLKNQVPLAISNSSLSRETAAGSYVFGLSAKSNIPQLDKLATFSDQETIRLSTLETDFAQNPKRAVARLENQRGEVERIQTALQALIGATNAAAFAEINTLRKTHSDAVEAASVASQQLFGASPLPEVGQAAWQKLWEAARTYADAVAYPGKTFPSGEPDTLCVLCQQPLSADAIARQQTFESFVKSSTKGDEVAARAKLDATLTQLKGRMLCVGDILKSRNFLATEIGDALLAQQVRRAFVVVLWRLRAMLRAYGEPKALGADPLQALTTLAADLKTRASHLSADTQSDDYRRLKSEYLELKERAALAPLLPDIKAHIARLKKIESINTALKATAKKPITDKNKELSDHMVTDALRGRFAREIGKLKLSRMPVELRKEKDRQAVSYFRVALVENPNAKVGEIFSEGEHRCVALAAFLAELVTAQRYSGIVFDDPMSSLDHVHRGAVASRLVEEAEHRQVIVFTHDLVFLYELRREAEKANRPIAFRNVRRSQDKPGYIENELPDKAKSGLEMCNSLRSSLKSAKPNFDKLTDTQRTTFCKGTIGQLRDAWEQAISDYVRPVLERFDNKVKPTSIFKLGILTEDDVGSVMAAQGRLSEDLHSSAQALNPEAVSLDDLLNEVKALEQWIQSIRDRQKNAARPVLR
ncbi:AAA family ATPase [Bradyrhizobium sp. 38]|uniref:AAA family ATPase n=1 Tax=unclassified Bradyrhizobium TaxID=2631580 RepID=UPI001FF775F8|nr:MULTISPECIES: AAA family ATPase [unclassified Bradyrhizobium]MCK1336619.1 AAA family ATPase [Bradyrhizobium sp. 38]MCK1776969.1 AAA family ATPase [Bradyrhizobium sp. 132]